VVVAEREIIPVPVLASSMFLSRLEGPLKKSGSTTTGPPKKVAPDPARRSWGSRLGRSSAKKLVAPALVGPARRSWWPGPTRRSCPLPPWSRARSRARSRPLSPAFCSSRRDENGSVVATKHFFNGLLTRPREPCYDPLHNPIGGYQSLLQVARTVAS